VQKIYNHLSVARFRRIHSRHIDYRSKRRGYAGMIDEIRHEVDALTPVQIKSAERAVLSELFGRPIIFCIRRIAAVSPKSGPAFLTRVTPRALQWLVGPMRRDGPTNLAIPHCELLAGAGPRACEKVCRVPTQDFFTEVLLVPTALDPDLSSQSCRVSFARPSRRNASRSR
jgi:hypothetical protein